MTDSFRIDDHKLYYHPERIAQWLQAGHDWEKLKKVYPLYVEMSPTGICNHRCRFCAMDYIGYKPQSMDFDIMSENIRQMGKMGVKSIMMAGEGEPLLYKKIVELSDCVVSSGIDLAFTTNGVYLTRKNTERLVPISTWIKVSIAAGSPQTYAYMHGTDKKDFERVIENLKYAVDFRNKRGLSCTIGAQFLLLADNIEEIEKFIYFSKDIIGLDYVVIKPYSQHMFSHTKEYISIDYQSLTEILSGLEKNNNDTFKVVVRKNAIKKAIYQARCEDVCNSVPFLWAYVMANHDLYSCSAFLQDNRFLIGNLSKRSFQEVWESDKRYEIFTMMTNGFDTSECRINCRMNAANKYLWDLKNPGTHQNFI